MSLAAEAEDLAWLLDTLAGGGDESGLPAILEEAARFATAVLAPLAPVMDTQGCRIQGGRVVTATGHKAAWRAFAEAGWAGMSGPDSAGGGALPMPAASAVQFLFDAANPAFGMLAINTRCATRLIAREGTDAIRARWLGPLTTGDAGATICISEPQAGSDVGRIRLRAEQGGDGEWRLSGEKCWISFGDHDLTETILHCVLARRAGSPPGTRGLSLFLVPDRHEDGAPNGVRATRIEEKLGLHGSPTCSMLFEDAVGIPLSPEGRGIQTLFTMISAMRLAVAVQGAAMAAAAVTLAEGYARDRCQGGDPTAPPLPIVAHAEVRRLLLGMRLRAEVSRLITLQAAIWLEDGETDSAAAARAGLLLPVAKTLGAEAAFTSADAAIQVLGGAGYVRDWPAERMLRDARVFSIYEGTTAIQGLDLLLRQAPAQQGAVLRDVLDRLKPPRPWQHA